MKIEITNQNKWHWSLTLKLALLAILGMMFLIPLELVKEVILERQKNAEKVKKEISDQWASKQTLTGPVLNIPVTMVPTENDEKPVNKVWHILPESLSVSGSLKPEIRYRGIYRSVLYESVLKVSGYFVIPPENYLKGYNFHLDDAYYTAGITDNRGLKGRVSLRTGAGEYDAEPGVRDNDLFLSGVSFDAPGIVPGSRSDFSMDINLAGSEGFQLTPLGKETIAHIESEWTSPSFNGSFLPVNRVINDKGFRANWEVTHLNRNFPQNWIGNSYDPLQSSFGLDLYQPVDHYQKSWRSVRYGILFIALTYLVLIFLEITRKEPIHIFHYFLVSLGLVLFFSLLNSLSEQIGFELSYTISSSATILLISAFLNRLLKDKRTSYIVFGMLVLLYSFIYVLLTLKDYAYLAGNIGLFILLAIIMRLAASMDIFKKSMLTGEPDNKEV
jgi:inner membrane protein